jgi:hypothetical protein
VIPTMIVFGVVLGRWWRVALVTAAIGWPLVLVATDVVAFDAGLIEAAALAVANAGVGVLAHQICLQAYRHRRNSHAVA